MIPKKTVQLLVVSLLMLSSSNVYAQYANDWYVATQSYYKIPVAEDGIYKVDFTQLEALGMPVQSINPRNIQLWRNGVEQHIYVFGEGDNALNAGDFIEFYGEYNDGSTDTPIWRTPEEQPHTYLSYFTDTSNYYLTWTTATAGKRIVDYTNTNYAGKVSDDWVWYETVVSPNDQFTDGSEYMKAGFYSEFTEGEGWFSEAAGFTIQRTFSLVSEKINTAGPDPELRFALYGKSNPQTSSGINHIAEVLINNRKVFEQRYLGYARVETDFNAPVVTLQNSDITSSTTEFRLIDNFSQSSRTSLSYATLRYARLLDLENKSYFDLDYQGNNEYFSFQNSNLTAPSVYDLANNRKVAVDQTGNDLQFITPTAGQKRLVIVDENAKKTVNTSSIRKVDFTNTLNPTTSSYDYIIITNTKLASSAADYQRYRESSEGGSYNVLTVYTDDLYEQYYYGLKHPLAIKNFCENLYQNQSIKPKHILMLGKGSTYERVRFDANLNKNDNLVPTWGIPPTDYFFVTNYSDDEESLAPRIAIGRVPARENEHVTNYLNKVKLHENGTFTSKKILYLTGGITGTEQRILKNRQESYHRIASDLHFGGDGLFISKVDADAIDESLTDDIQDILEDGTAVLSYFGHGAAQVLELDIGSVKDLDNQGKYPLFVFNGCALGNSFVNTSLPEEFLLEEDNGGIAWVSSSSFGIENSLFAWTTIFYRNLYDKNYGESVGKIIQNTTGEYQDPTNAINRSQCRQMTYHGDPALHIYSPSEADYTVSLTADKDKILPLDYNAELDSFALKVILENKGKAVAKEPLVYAEVNYSNDSVRLFGPYNFGRINSTKDVVISIPNNAFSRGLTRIRIKIDYSDSIPELAPFGELNNTLDYEFLMPSNSLTILDPLNDEIIAEQDAVFTVQVNNFLKDEESEVLFQVDTTPLFNSPILHESATISGNNIISYSYTLPPLDSTDFFWRARFNSPAGVQESWESGTFAYIPNSPNGWSQGYFDKLRQTSLFQMALDTALRNVNFQRFASEPYQMYASGIKQSVVTRGIVINPHKAIGRFLRNGIEVVSVNPDNLERFSEEGSVYNRIVASRDEKGVKYHITGQKSGVYWFDMRTKENRDSFVDYMDRVPEGYRVLLATSGDMDIANWEEEVYEAIEYCGGYKIRIVGQGEPYGIIGEKGGPILDETLEITADYSLPDPQSQGDNKAVLLFPLNTNGTLTSRSVGPSTKWTQFYYRLYEESDSPDDSIAYTIIGVRKDQTESILYQNRTELSTDLTAVDAKEYPRLKIQTYYEDASVRTPLQQKRWTLLYDGIPEGSMMPNIAFSLNNDTLQEGDSLRLEIAFQNISELDFDSLLVLTVNRTSANRLDTVEYIFYPPLAAGDSMILNYVIGTMGNIGNNTLNILVNPNQDQLEETLANNVLNVKYTVLRDERNPILDVVFDGKHILDFDIVNPSPSITMTVLDENEFIFIDNPSAFEAVIEKLDIAGNTTGEIDSITYVMPNVTFTPASSGGQKAILEYLPEDLASGKYQLRVAVKDGSGNPSSDLDYMINFEVIREASITNLYPYPNPFTTSMRFVYTLTGETVPDYMKIQILTVSGKIVREITQDELGSIQIGNNISEFAWDGTDEFGDQLANGVYLYKVRARLNGEEIQLRESGGDQFFTNGIGKIYLMR